MFLHASNTSWKKKEFPSLCSCIQDIYWILTSNYYFVTPSDPLNNVHSYWIQKQHAENAFITTCRACCCIVFKKKIGYFVSKESEQVVTKVEYLFLFLSFFTNLATSAGLELTNMHAVHKGNFVNYRQLYRKTVTSYETPNRSLKVKCVYTNRALLSGDSTIVLEIIWWVDYSTLEE